LCLKCRKKRETGEGLLSDDDFLASIRDCCSRAPEFITPRLPILESVFRLFLANNNQPLDLEELGKRLSQWRGGGASGISEILAPLLENDRYYGVRRVET
jgi:hypothetical protein